MAQCEWDGISFPIDATQLVEIRQINQLLTEHVKLQGKTLTSPQLPCENFFSLFSQASVVLPGRSFLLYRKLLIIGNDSACPLFAGQAFVALVVLCAMLRYFRC